jgi:enhancer of polycomb-like protein
MSKLSFRSRQVDYTKPLPIYFTNDLPDLQDIAAINRSVPQMPTGMEKDEESEHHLQRALSALQAFGATSSNEYAIPTPKVQVDDKLFQQIYKAECNKFKQYIRIQPFSNDYDYPDYDADYDDEDWLKEQCNNKPDIGHDELLLFFETIIDRLEKATGHSTNLMSRDEAKLLLTKENQENNDTYNEQKYNKTQKEEFILCIYEYWKAKRLKYVSKRESFLCIHSIFR